MSSRKVNSPKPKWWRLYATFPLLFGLLVAEHQLPLSVGGHQAAQIGLILATFGFMYGWLRANAVALLWIDSDQSGSRYTVMEYRPASPAEDNEDETGHRPIFYMPESGLRDTLEDTFELEAAHRNPTDISLN